MENNPDVLAMVAASAALTISGIPFMGPIGAARVGYVDGEYVLNLAVDRRADSKLDLVMAGTADAVLMVESEAQELSEDVMLGAVLFGHEQAKKVIDAIIKLAELAAKEPRDFQPVDNSAFEAEMLTVIETDLRAAYSITKKEERYAAVDAAKAKVKEHYAAQVEAGTVSGEVVGSVFHDLQAKIVRWNILDTKKRIDGRDLVTVRPIQAEVGVLPRTHGSALFTRGETQALVVATLGTGDDEQYLDTLEGTMKQNFMLHYNFPPYSVGEAGRMGSPGRREIGHGKLAWRAINPIRPTAEQFPYTIRVVSEITESNGSSSMATVCGTSPCADGCRRADGASGGGHRDGPDPRGREVRRPLGHPRRRGSPRRHGLQGRRHRRGRHLAPDGHQDRRHHRRDHEDRARSGQGRAHAHPRRDGQAPSPRRVPRSASSLRASRPSPSRPTRSAK